MIKILLVKQDSTDLLQYKEILKKRGVEWVEIAQPITGTVLSDSGTREIYCETFHHQYGETVDAVQFFLPPKDWPESRSLLGRMFNTPYSGYLTSVTRMRRGYEQTAEHELLHKADNLIYIYLGLNINVILGISDWDTEVVHGDHPDFAEYNYDRAWELIRPYLDEALAKRRRVALLSYYQQLLILLRKTLLQLQARTMEIQGLRHPLEYASVSYKYGVPDLRYTLTEHHIGTDYATQLKTDILAPKDGEVTVSGYSASLGNFCHYKYTRDGKIFVARFLHLDTIPYRDAYQRGEVFAESGNTGDSDGPHCHIDVWRDEVRLDLINKTNWSELTVDPEEHFG